MTDLTLAALTETIARAIDKYPAERGRIERAAQLIATGHVDQISADAFAVRSQTDEAVYIVDETGCPCVDARRHPGQSCKHVWSVDLLQVAAERARRQSARSDVPTEAAPQAVTVDGRQFLASLIEERGQRGRIVAAQGGRAIDDERCRLLDEQIVRLRANLAPVSLRETVAA